MITQQQVREAFDYDPETGEFFRLFKNGARKLMKPSAADGRVRVQFLGRDFHAHRLIWLYSYGRSPENFIDHINGDPSDNRLVNLREATDAENKRNVGKRSHNTSGFKGVTFDKQTGRWLAHATFNGKGKHLGRHSTPEAAAAAYRAFAQANHEQFYREDEE